jgi:hypothetical protein
MVDTRVRKPGLPLNETGVLSEENRRRLEALSVTTAEELLGMISADPEATSAFLGEDGDLARIQADLGQKAGAQTMALLKESEEEHFAFGAKPPAGIEKVQQADPQLFEERVLPAAEEDKSIEVGKGTNIGGCMGPLRDQGERGTCVAHAVCALAECLYFKKTGERLDFSEQFLYWNAKEHDDKPDQEGTLIQVAVDLSVSDGNCLEETWPYNSKKIPHDEGQGPPPEGAAPEARERELVRAGPLGQRSTKDVCDRLDAGKPVALSVPVFQNWDGNPAVNTFGEIPMPLPTSKCVGGHAMCAVGYEPDSGRPGGGYLVLRNSWGGDWAPQSPVAPGHALLPFLYFELYGWESFSASL